MISKQILQENFIDKNEVFELMSLSLSRDMSAGLSHISEWTKSSLTKKPLEIYDINGELLFLDFSVKEGTANAGIIRAAANKVIGVPVVSYQIGDRLWDYETALKKTTAKARKDFSDKKITGNKLVCYSYPKIGIMFEFNDGSKAIYDAADFSNIPLKPKEKDYEGAYAWSFYDSFNDDDAKQKIKNFNIHDDFRLKLNKKTREGMLTFRKIGDLIDPIRWKFKFNVEKKLQYCSHYKYNETNSHHCFVLHAQQVNDYCAVATCQMVLCYYRYYYSQDEIAPACGYSAGGGCPADSSAGYETKSCNHIDAAFDGTATWEKGKTEIDGLHPFKSGVPGHARAIAGYSYTYSVFSGATNKKLLVYDPWPWNADLKAGGAVYFEEWDAVTHTNFITTKLKCP